MNDIFIGVLDSIRYDDITRENIAVQVDGEFTANLDKQISNLTDNFKLVGVPNGVGATRFKELNDGMVELSKLLTERFGLPIHLLHSNALAYVLPITGTFGTMMDVDRDEITSYIKEHIGLSCKGSGCKTKDVDKYRDDSFLTNDTIIVKIHNEMKIMNSLFNKGKIEVSRKDAKISGFMDEARKLKMKVPIGVNIGALIDLGATDRQIAAIILHEVGHQFSYIDYAANLTKTAASPLQSLTDNKTSRIKKRKIIIEEFGDLVDNDEAKLHELPVKIFNSLIPNKNNNTAFFNSEITADQFASRFGYGEEVVMALNNFHFSSERDDPIIDMLLALLVIAILIAIIVYTGDVFYMFNATLVLVPTAIGLLFNVVFAGMGLNLIDEHEQSYARTRRIKLEMIRMMRTSKEMPKSLKKTIEDIISLDNYLIETAKDKEFSSLLISWMSGTSKERGYHELYQRTEQLMENDLHINVAKIKARRKGK